MKVFSICFFILLFVGVTTFGEQNENVKSTINPSSIEDLGSYFKTAEGLLNEALKDSRDGDPHAIHQKFRKAIDEAIDLKIGLQNELLFRSVLRRARLIDDIVVSQNDDASKELGTRILRDMMTWAITLTQKDQKNSLENSQLNFSDLGLATYDYIAEIESFITDHGQRFKLLLLGMNLLTNDFNQDLLARKTLAPVIQEINEYSVSISKSNPTSDLAKVLLQSQIKSFLSDKIFLAQALTTGDSRPKVGNPKYFGLTRDDYLSQRESTKFLRGTFRYDINFIISSSVLVGSTLFLGSRTGVIAVYDLTKKEMSNETAWGILAPNGIKEFSRFGVNSEGIFVNGTQAHSQWNYFPAVLQDFVNQPIKHVQRPALRHISTGGPRFEINKEEEYRQMPLQIVDFAIDSNFIYGLGLPIHKDGPVGEKYYAEGTDGGVRLFSNNLKTKKSKVTKVTFSYNSGIDKEGPDLIVYDHAKNKLMHAHIDQLTGTVEDMRELHTPLELSDGNAFPKISDGKVYFVLSSNHFVTIDLKTSLQEDFYRPGPEQDEPVGTFNISGRTLVNVGYGSVFVRDLSEYKKGESPK